MKSIFTLLLSFAILVCSISCKRQVLDMNKYKDLLFEDKPVPPPPVPVYIFAGKVGSEDWNTRGNAIIASETMIITAAVKNKTFLIKLNNYKCCESFLIGHGDGFDSAAVFDNGSENYSYASTEGSSGQVTIVRLDNNFNQIEARFSMILFNDNRDSIKVEGYFKINFTPNSIQWEENQEPNIAHEISCVSNSISYEVIGTDTLNKKILTIIWPKNTGSATTSTPIKVNSLNGLPAVYYRIGDGAVLKAVGGTVKLISNTGNVLKGSYSDLLFGANPREPDYFIGGSFSAKY